MAENKPKVIQNRKAHHDFEIVERFKAGLQLVGTEIKSIRQGKINFVDSFCFFRNGELFIKNMHVSEYEQGNIYNHEPKRERKLLLTKQELRKLEQRKREKGLTIVPLKLFFERGYAKLEIGLAKGKKTHDKREAIKEKDLKREMERVAR
jgi:SsrA-binding protein